ncbi:peptidylprolyl isomerase [Rheinheimera texasensis]|jgi:peptidyl-prolyl cis-trans isomerase A (cyclophilin A)|uniref:peptidylprolyl isomerase n=1 Tax=Rheinheimera texasensis TaxID=306205 RepID=UPI0004E1B283|nr:peptidylprolyl isomerase [Rheinheimera texasensis]
MKRLFALICLLSSSLVFAAGEHIQKDNLFPRVKLITTEGDIVIELDRMKAALTVNNFLTYVDKKMYDGTVFHRLEPEFVLQGGGYDREYVAIKNLAEIPNESGNGLKNIQYSVAMAHQEKGPHTATNQFFINLNENTSLNPGKNWGYAVFGNVVEGIETIEKIRKLETGLNEKLGWENVPKKPVVIARAILLPAK